MGDGRAVRASGPALAEAEATARLEDFLQARIEGEGAEEFVEVEWSRRELDEVPLLYATTAGAPYERSEIERRRVARVWPFGEMEFKVRLFADGGETVVEQLFSLNHETARLRLAFGLQDWPRDRMPATTENGQAVPVPYGFFDGEVTSPRTCRRGRQTFAIYEGLATWTTSSTTNASCCVARPAAGRDGLRGGPGSRRRRGAGPEHPVRPRPRGRPLRWR